MVKKEKVKKMNGSSYLPQDEFIERLKNDFPGIFTEDSKIDIEKLKAILGENADLGERYGLSWKGKSEVFRTIQETITKTLKPIKDGSIDFDTSENIFIEGDNLEALKILQRSYYGKVNMIYIDPPYNTGNEFVYNDKFSQNLEEYEIESGIRDGNGNIKETSALYKNTRDSGHFHSNWLNMMYPRLYLARNLLCQNGVIFISIDDNEVYNLHMILNEIFGEENFVTCLVRKTKTTSNNGTFFAPSHEYILIFAKAIQELEGFSDPEAQEDEAYLKLFKNEDEYSKYNEIGLYQPSLKHGGSRYPIECPDGSFVITPNNKPWRWNEGTYKKNLANNQIIFKETKTSPLLDSNGKQSKWNIYTKIYLKDRLESGMRPISFIDKYPNSEATKDLLKMVIPFDFSKPVNLIKYLIKITQFENGIILDFFAGSGTTAHAVMQLNAEDGGNRKWIMVQLPEETDKDSEARKAGYKNIADIAKERIRRAAKQIKEGNNRQLPLHDRELDLGFKIFKVDKTNFKVWDSGVRDAEKLENQMLEMLDTVRIDAKEEDLLFELMIKSGIDPTVKRKRKSEKGQDYWKIGDGELIICLEDKMTKELFQTILTEKPQKIILLDRSFTEDQLKKNLILQAEKGNIEMLVV